MSLASFAMTLLIEGLETVSRDLGISKMWHRNKAAYRKIELAGGTGQNQADVIWSDVRTLAGTNETLDLAGSLTSQLDGSTVTFAKIKGIYIKNHATTTGYTLTIGDATAPITSFFAGTTPRIVIGAGGEWVLTSPIDGFTVTATTADGLKINSGSNTVEYEIIIWGTSV